ncbi:polysaccharide biosynthesis tyrosine autokinase [Labilibacter sediminis]|nr:polysaccharide biosynthesis tyrosine autokinase [Labilibacter sediminis]
MSIKNDHSTGDNYLDVRKILKLVRKNWYWFTISVIFFIGLAFAAGKVLKPKYLVSTSVYIKEDTGLEGQKAMEFMRSFNLFDQKMNHQNEMLILKSSPLIREAVEKLNLETAYYKKENFLDSEIYMKSPFVVMIDSLHPQIINTSFNVSFKEDGKFILSVKNKDYKIVNYHTGKSFLIEKEIDVEEEYFQSSVIESEDYKFRIFLKNGVDLKKIIGEQYSFKFFSKNQLVRELQEGLKVEPVNLEVSVVELSMKTQSRTKGIDFLHTLTQLYLHKNLERKNHLALNTISYINSQLNEIADSLSLAESRLEDFRASNQVINITTKASGVLERLRQLELGKETTQRTFNYYKYLDEYFQQGSDYSEIVVPSSMGITNLTLSELVKNLLILSKQRDDLIGRKQEKSPYLKNLDVEIKNLSKSIVENIRFSLEQLQRELNDYDKQIVVLEEQVENLPKTERQLVGIERKFQINDAIYTFLLQKRADAQIAKASNLPEHEIVEPARVIEKVFPDTKIHLVLAVFLGLLIPSLIITIRELIDDRIKNEDMLTDTYSNTPFLGTVIRNTESDEELVVHNSPVSAISETFRTIRTNLFFFIKREEHKTILVSSCIAGEGKSFIAFNLATSLATMGKKTIIVGYDMRKKGQFKSFEHNRRIGLSSYYVKDKVIDEIIQSSHIDHLDFIVPGVIPPNPLELIGTDMTTTLIEDLKKKYDYIVFDTPPVGVLSDGYLLMKHADVNLFVVREKFTRKQILNTVLQDVRQKEFKNFGLVLNASKMDGRRYRYDYYNKYNNSNDLS